MWLTCQDIPIDVVENIFKEKTESKANATDCFALYIPPMDNLLIPADLLTDTFVTNRILLQQDISENTRLRIDPAAFMSSRNFLRIIHIVGFDVGELDFYFLQGFQKLDFLIVSYCINIHLANWTTLLDLPSLTSLEIANSRSGLEEWTLFPTHLKGLRLISMTENGIDTPTMDRILKWILDSSASTLKQLNIAKNAMTQIPNKYLFEKILHLLMKEECNNCWVDINESNSIYF